MLPYNMHPGVESIFYFRKHGSNSSVCIYTFKVTYVLQNRRGRFKDPDLLQPITEQTANRKRYLMINVNNNERLSYVDK